MPSARVTLTEATAPGGSGGSSGVAATYQGWALGATAPLPPELMARRWKRYSVPLVRPLTVWDVVVESLLGIATQSCQATPLQRI